MAISNHFGEALLTAAVTL